MNTEAAKATARRTAAQKGAATRRRQQNAALVYDLQRERDQALIDNCMGCAEGCPPHAIDCPRRGLA